MKSQGWKWKTNLRLWKINEPQLFGTHINTIILNVDFFNLARLLLWITLLWMKYSPFFFSSYYLYIFALSQFSSFFFWSQMRWTDIEIHFKCWYECLISLTVLYIIYIIQYYYRCSTINYLFEIYRVTLFWTKFYRYFLTFSAVKVG